MFAHIIIIRHRILINYTVNNKNPKYNNNITALYIFIQYYRWSTCTKAIELDQSINSMVLLMIVARNSLYTCYVYSDVYRRIASRRISLRFIRRTHAKWLAFGLMSIGILILNTFLNTCLWRFNTREYSNT